MVNQDLLNYIQSALQAGEDPNNITLNLVTSGWQSEDIQEALESVNIQSHPQKGILSSNKNLIANNRVLSFVKNAKIIFFLSIIFVLVVTIAFVSVSIRNSQKKATSKLPTSSKNKVGFESLIPQSPKQGITSENSPSYRIFLKIIPGEGRNKSYQLTLIAPDGKLIKTLNTKYQLVLKASLKDMWLFGETFSSCVDSLNHPDDMTSNCNYWLLHSDGRFEKVVESFNKELVAALGGSYELKHFFPVSNQEVLYQGCENVSGCKITKVNLITGKKENIPIGEGYKFFEIMGVSQNFSKIYIWDRFPRSTQEYNDKIFHLLTLNHQSGQVEDSPIKGITSSSKTWISPNGKYIVYVEDSYSIIQVYDVERKQNHSVRLPKRFSAGGLGGDTLPTPIWSPDSSKFLFESFAFIPSTETEQSHINKMALSYIDVNSMSVFEIFSYDTTEDIVENKKNSSDFHHQINGLGWFDNDTPQFTIYRYDNFETNIQSVNNYEFNTDTKKLKTILNNYGQLLGEHYF